MSPVLANLVAAAGNVQRQSSDQQRRILAYLLTAYGASALGQPLALASFNTTLPSVAQSVWSKFQGLTDEQFNDILTYQLALTLNTNGVLGIVAPGAVPTDGFALNNLVNTAWGAPNGVVNAQVLNSLLQYGFLIQFGANFTGL